MGYTTDFAGKFKLNRPLTAAHLAYLLKFPTTRRMQRNALMTAKLPDPLREAVGLPVGDGGGYYVGAASYSNNDSKDVTDGNKPPHGQPGLWCQWTPTDDGTAVEWDGGEKFYNYVEWLNYLIVHFLQPWGYTLNGRVIWTGEDSADKGTIIVTDNKVNTEPGHHADTDADDQARQERLVAAGLDAAGRPARWKKALDKPVSPVAAAFAAFLTDACGAVNDLWVVRGGQELKDGELAALKDTLSVFFGDKL